MKIRNNTILCLLFWAIFWGGCLSKVPPDSVTTSTMVQTVQASPTASLEPTSAQTLQRTPNFNPTAIEPTATLPQPPDSVLQYQRLEIMPALPSGTSISERLVVGSELDYILNLADQTQQSIPDVNCLLTSPNGRWLAYCNSTDDPDDRQLIIQDLHGQIQAQLPIGKDRQYRGVSWLDNERLVLNVRGGTERIYPVMVVNPFTGEHQELSSDYPNIQPESLGPVSSVQFHFLYTSVVYHPSLKLAIYPEYTDEGFFVVLWDRQAQKALARVKDLGEFLHIPEWSPDGSHFIVAAIVQGNDPGRAWIEEFFEVSQDGYVDQVTHFGDFFSHAQIGNVSWSPDGQHLAFWLATNSGECGEGQNLAIMEIKTRQITNTCIPGSPYYDSPSLSGR